MASKKFSKRIADFTAYHILPKFYELRKSFCNALGVIPFETAFYLGQKYLSKDDIVIDVGCPGGLTYPIEKFYNNKIYAFEPMSEGYNGLVESTKCLLNVVPVHCALSDFEGTADLSIPKDYCASSILPINEDLLLETVSAQLNGDTDNGGGEFKAFVECISSVLG